MRESGGGQRWVLPVVLVAVVLTAVAGLLAREFYLDPVTRTSPPASAVVPTESAVPAAAQPGPRDVRGTADAVGHPLYETTRQLLQTHFDAINGKNYDRWKTTVTDDRVKAMPEPDWQRNYATTTDGTIVVYRIETGPPNTARVLLTFVSKQDPADAPPELPVDCIRWSVVYPLILTGGQWRLDMTATGASPQHDPC
ncbi:hypothetical protein UO65_3298 [Actinokineospora spheciospongiae]|uniref:Uncharacterized protein n=1 Tax=Actinokineospora spheciospongiae TaxID=909613 RepID=W7IKP9_9PSEU|nr:hypothetical protein [Actinokineospora spheciospongiae]EWC61445.1 hypothetical protein UO65_3298 [Actinokineospora spheciospongiae]